MRTCDRRPVQRLRGRTALCAVLLLLLGPTAARAAGNVRVTPKGGGLVLTGDAADNDVVIDQNGLGADQFRVASGSDITTINGQAGPLIFPGVDGGIRIGTGGGEDRLRLETCALPQNLDVAGKQGRVDLEIFQCDVLGKLGVKTGDGDDAISIDDSEISGAVQLKVGKGGSDISIADATIGGDLKVDAKDGSDAVALSNTVVDGQVRISDGAGSSDVNIDGSMLHGDLKIASKKDGGANRVFQLGASSIHGSVQLKAGGAADVTVGVDDTSITGDLVVLAGTTPTDATISGGSTVGGLTEIRTKKAPSDVHISDSDLQGALQQRIQGSFGSMELENSSFGDDVTADMGSGGSIVVRSCLMQQEFKVDANSTPLFLDIDDLTVLMPSYIESGSGTDTFQIDDSSFAMLMMDVRNGIDSLEIERGGDPDNGPGTSFAGVVLISTSRQDDTVLIGEAGAAGRFVDFGAAVTIDGETENDLIDYLGNGNLFAEPPEILNFETIL